MNGVEGEPDARALDAVKDEERNRHDDEAEIVVVHRIVEIDRQGLDIGKGRNELDALRPAEQPSQLAPFPDQPDDLARGERADQKIEALHPEQRKAQQKGDQPREGCARQHGQWHGDSEFLGHQRRAVGADAHDHDMGKRPFAGERQQPVARDQEHVDDEKNQELLLRQGHDTRQHDQPRQQKESEHPGQSVASRALKHVPWLRTGRSASRSTRSASTAGRQCWRASRHRSW